MKFNIPKNAEYIIDELYKNGYEAYVVGGCVRDMLLNKEPKDWDITTSASPRDVKRLFKRTVDTGIRHGTITVMMENEGYEVTTYRIDGEYDDSRHPKEVIFTSSLVEDLKRRDFTINAMAYNHKNGLVDCFDGANDLQKGIIQCVGIAKERFEEDALRMLRAVRFSAQLDFLIEEKTKAAIIEKASNLKKISAERIKTEIDKTLLSKNPEKIHMAYQLGITKNVLPEFDKMMLTSQENPNHIYNVGEHTLTALKYVSGCEEAKKLDKKEYLILMWATFLHDIGKPKAKVMDEDGIAHFYKHDLYGKEISRDVFKRLKFDNYTLEKAIRLITVHDYTFRNTKPGIRRAVNNIGDDIMKQLFILKRADIMAQSEKKRSEKLEKLEKSIEIYNNVEDDCVTVKDLDINGQDLIDIGMKPGKDIGIMLKYLLDIVIEEPLYNKKDNLLNLVKDKINNLE